DASFNYSAAAYCVDASDPTPTITGLTGGTFSSTLGLSITAGTGLIDVSASTPGTYTVTYTTAGTCPNSSTASVTINALDDASFNYSAAAYCVDASDPTPTITGLTGGTFSSTLGLSITAGTGLIDVSASTPGTYTVTYTTAGTCPNSSTASVTINALDDASFNYSAAAYCVDAIDPTPTITGLTGGTFSSTLGLSITAGTGLIDVSASTPGTYTVTYTTAGTCPNSSTASVTINALDDASFNYSAAAYCVDASDPTPTITGLTGGTFSSTLGLSLTAGTGQIDVSASTPGTYTVTYTTAGTCPNSSTASVTINALDDASFNYSAAAYCVDASDPTPTITGLTGGTFSSTLGLSITAGTGLIDVSASTPGTYTVTYTTAGTCPNSSTASVTINALDDASFNYSAAAYCVDASDPTPTITGLTGGTYSSTLGLSITAGTGLIDVSASTPGTYTVTYTTAGTCPNSSTASVTINALDDASFNYSAAAYCVDAIDPTPTITGLTGGTFSSTVGLSLTAGTGLIDVSASTPGTYTVTYTTAGTCPNSSTASVTINALDDASFNYSAAAYCVDASDPTPTITGLTGGTFSSTLGLSITAGTGLIDVSASTPGTYTVTYTTAGTCPNSSIASVTINALDDASFNYSAAAYCVDAIDPTPTITGLTGGTFSSTLGLSITAGTGLIDVSASTPGTYTVTYTTAGTCPNSSTTSVTINALDDASFNYSAAAYCVDAIDPTPTITGLTGGTFSSTLGLSLTAGTGLIDVSASTPGTYTVTYTTAGTCPNSSTASVTINALDDASFNYSAAAYCVDASDPTPTITGLTSGTFSSTLGLSLTAGTGLIDVSASTPGTYTVTYTTAGTCPNSSTASVTINALDDASFNYSAAAYCVDASDPTPTITGLTGGTFSSTLGLSITAGTGLIDVSASTPGTYTVTYTTAGTCPNSSTASVTINALDDASFNYSAAAYCVDASDPTPTITGLTGGTFSSTLGLSITAGTGLIDVSASTPGTYTVTYTTAGTCPNSSTASVTINALDDASFNYSAAAYCVDASDPTPTITGLTGGTFSSTVGLSLTAGTGLIDVSTSTPGTYTVTYTTAGTCPNSSTASVTINALDDASFNYSAAAYCVDASDPTPTITGLTGGTFSSTVGLSLTAGTGLIDVSTSTPGTYTVTYTTAGTCPNSSTASVTINALDDASFNYSAAAYCVDAIDPTPTITGLTGGTFSSTLGLSLTAGTGLIDVSA
ncbi:beta strand repeat-containing protein, partial [Flavivirga jejuensis]